MAKAIQIGIKSKLSIDDIVNVAVNNTRVRLDPKSKKIIDTRRSQIVKFISSQNYPAYGFNRGFGHNVDLKVNTKSLSQLQSNLIRSHSAGMGEETPKHIIRAAMLLRAHSLAQGFSGVRSTVITQILNFLNANIVPHVPKYGSVGASGDLAPLSHIALALTGEGEGFDNTSTKRAPMSKILKRHKIKPIILEMKEGLALNNGVQFSNAIGVIAVHEIRKMLKVATIATALTNQVMLGSDTAYDKDLLKLRPHQGIQVIGKWLRSLIKGSPIREAHRPYEVDGEIQEPYNLRCAPQILGTCYDLIEEAAQCLEIEANSVTDNPLILPIKNKSNTYARIISGGHFHGMPVAVKIYNLVQAMGIMSSLSNIRCARYVDEKRNKGLPSDLVWPKLSAAEQATSSGMMIPEYASAALTNFIWGASMPSHLFSLSTDAGQEDHVSMSATLGMRFLDTLPRLADILAIELAFAAQAAAIRKEVSFIPTKHNAKLNKECHDLLELVIQKSKVLQTNKSHHPVIDIKMKYHLTKENRKLSPLCEKIVKDINKIFPTIFSDRVLSKQLCKLAQHISTETFLGQIPLNTWRKY